MYTLKASYVKSNWQWEMVDISSMRIDVLATLYQEVRFVLSWNGGQDKMCDLKSNMIGITPTQMKRVFADWLATVTKDELLPGGPVKFLSRSKKVTSYNWHVYNIKIKPGNHRFAADAPIPVGEDDDLVVTSPEAKSFQLDHVKNLADNVLFFVNGQIVKHYRENDRLFLLDAHTRLKHSPEQQIGVISFAEVGGIKIAPIKESDITVAVRNENDLANHQTRVRVKINDTFGNYTPLLVMDGHIHILTGDYKVVDTDKMDITIDHRHAIRMAIKYPFSQLDFMEPANVLLNGLRADRFDVKKYLTLDNSFIVLIKSTDIALFREAIQSVGVERQYTHHRAPVGIVQFEDGSLTNWLMLGYNQWNCAFATLPNRNRDWAVDGMPWLDQNAVAETPHTDRKKWLMDAKVTEIYTF